MPNQIVQRRRWRRLLTCVLLVTIVCLSSCAPKTTETPEEYVQRAYAYNSKGQYDLAIADCGKAIELGALLSAPNLAHAYVQRAYAYNSKGQYDLAIVDCGKAIELAPNLAHAYALRAYAYNRKGQYDLAIDDYSKASELDPNLEKPTPTPVIADAPTSSEVTSNSSVYDEKTVELLGQTYLVGSPPRLLVDGKSGVNIAGNTAGLQRGFYRLTGEYDADTNTLNVTEFDEEEVKHLTIEAAKRLDIGLLRVSLIGLIATTPKEVANTLTSYISIPHFPENIPIYPYVVYARDGFYLVLSDTLVSLPAEFKFLYEGKDYSFTFSAGAVSGILVKTPLEGINFGPKWEPDEFGGVIIANSISSFAPLNTTVEQINAEPDKYAFNRVSVTASYLVTTATLDYSDIKAPMGQGVLAETFTDFFGEDSKKRLETIDPERKVWQLRECQVTGTVIYPTEQILKYLDYSAPLSKSEVIERLKPVLIVDTLVDEEVEEVNISELNPIVGHPSQYWGKVVEFEGYALGIKYPLKTLVKTVTGRDIPLNVNLLAVGIADKPAVGSQIAIIGLNNDLIGEQGEIIKGKYKFKVAVTHMPEELVSGVPYVDTALFLLTKEELPIEIPTLELYRLNVSISPSGTGVVVPPGGMFQSGTQVTLTAVPTAGYQFDHWSGDASGTSSITTITMNSDKSVTAHFKSIIVTHSLSVSVDPSGAGSVTLTPPGGSYPSSTQVTLTAVPTAAGYQFDHWSGDASGTSPITTITMDSDKHVTAHFKRTFWSGFWQDTNSNDWNEFSLSPLSEVQIISAVSNEIIWVDLTWNDANDYDLYLYRIDNWDKGARDVVDKSTNRQHGNDYPRETIACIAPVTGVYGIAIRRVEGLTVEPLDKAREQLHLSFITYTARS